MSRALGIEVGPGFVALCELDVTGSQAPRDPRLGHHVFPGGEPPAPEEIADACLRMAVELGIGERSAVLALARSLTYAKPVRLPPLEVAERRSLVALQPERFFPVPDRPLVSDLDGDANGGTPVAHAADAERTEALVEALQSRGFRIGAVIPAAAALMRAVSRGAPALASSRWLLVRPEGEELTAHAFDAQALRASRRIEGFAADPTGTCREIARTARQAFGDGLAAEELRWSGWRDLPEGLKKIASATLPLAARDLPEIPVASEGLAAYGAALATLEESPRPDLMPPAVLARRRQQSRWVTAACAALVALGALALLWALGERQDARLRRLDAALAQARPGAEAAARTRDRAQVLEDRMLALEARMEERSRWLALLNELSRSLPAGAWIASLSVEGTGEVSLSGYAATASALVPALEESSALTAVELASPAMRAPVGNRELEAFNIHAVLEGSPADSAARSSAAAAGAASAGRSAGTDIGSSP